MKYFHTFILIVKGIDTRPTKYFIFLVLSIIGLFFLAYMHNYNIVYIMMFFIFSLAGASSIIGRLNLYEIEVSHLSTVELFAQTSSPYTLNIYNTHEQRDSFVLEFKNEESEAFLAELPASTSKTITLNFTPIKRGLSQLPPIQLGSFFPLPHELLFKKISLNNACIVYPQPKGQSLEKFTSKHKSFTGEYDDFEGIRSFQEGESLSRIFWPSLAKSQELMAKDFSLLQKSKHLHFNFLDIKADKEVRLSQLCLWAIECKKKNITYTMHFPSIGLDSTKRSHHEILEFLALY